ncbi:MAG TPA: MobA/MobL family protein [Novimethylophilus sp.]|uniref:MobA/MobL family protein n=1 Tax=Novimethylophilus sp. TaxID=2137426 RepID=UPI002F3F5122
MRTFGGLNSIAAMATFHLTTKFGSKSRGERGVDKFDYINRNGRFSKKHEGPLVYALSGNMPSWASDDPREFWIAADEYERANGALYHEIEFALPRELSLDLQIAAANEFARQIVGNIHPYSLGMHGNDGNPHVHLMFCGRKLDGIERSSDLFFKRANKKNPELGGCVKTATEERGKEWVIQIRQDWQDIANRHLSAAGSTARIDHRSYKDQGLDIAPGVHLGRRAVRSEQKGRLTRKGEINRSIAGVNAQLRNTQTKIQQEKNHGRKRILARATENLRAADHNIATARRNHPTADQVRRALHSRDLARAVATHHAASGHDRGEIDCNENLDRRQQYKAQLLQKHYHTQISAALASRLTFIQQKEDGLTISFQGGQITDKGDRLATRYGNSREAIATIDLAIAKGWKQIRVTGSEKFKTQIYIEAMRAGLTVVGFEPPAEIRTKLEKEKIMSEQAGAGAAMTPDPSPGENRNTRWIEPLSKARKELEAQQKLARERIQELHEIDIKKLKESLAARLGGTEYQSALEKKRKTAEAHKNAGSIGRLAKEWQAKMAYGKALQMYARLIMLPEAVREIAKANEQNQAREKLAETIASLNFEIGKIQYYQWQIERGQDVDQEFQDIWMKRRKTSSLKGWQEAVLQPVFTADAARERARLQAETEATEKLRESKRQEQAKREIAAQHKADQLHDQLSQSDLSNSQREAIESEMHYFEALANGHDEDEARERAAKKSNAPRPR